MVRGTQHPLSVIGSTCNILSSGQCACLASLLFHPFYTGNIGQRHGSAHSAKPWIMETISLPHLLDHPLRVILFTHVQNASFLRQNLLEGNTDFEYAFLDASVLLSRNHVLAACFRAVNDSINGRLKSRNVHSEIVFSLSTNNNVRCRPACRSFCQHLTSNR
jgi:hypothetical protein